ncbi:hypothetical protein P280DRAFT_267295 [Massarina eburnea CBS 473.64]|uniref:Uncharacterized protein n=1 Tax=Massarina eburnea CBS 473.64 TaxID=1395130 RepID=A0A6A6S8L4_9PLEO|nr:hypothetical protein P280DRAFT_267295 [Massarina eburnea CBS 473.64]
MHATTLTAGHEACLYDKCNNESGSWVQSLSTVPAGWPLSVPFSGATAQLFFFACETQHQRQTS